MLVAIRTKVMRFTPQKECPVMIKSLSAVFSNMIFHVAEVIGNRMGWDGICCGFGVATALKVYRIKRRNFAPPFCTKMKKNVGQKVAITIKNRDV